MISTYTRSGNGKRGKSGARVRHTLERARRDNWAARRAKSRARFRRQKSGWLDPFWSGDDGSNLNLFATGALLIHKGRKP